MVNGKRTLHYGYHLSLKEICAICKIIEKEPVSQENAKLLTCEAALEAILLLQMCTLSMCLKIAK